jgi:hypothetical protein
MCPVGVSQFRVGNTETVGDNQRDIRYAYTGSGYKSLTNVYSVGSLCLLPLNSPRGVSPYTLAGLGCCPEAVQFASSVTRR